MVMFPPFKVFIVTAIIYFTAFLNGAKESVHSSLHLHKSFCLIVGQHLQVLLQLIHYSGLHNHLVGIHKIFHGLQDAMHCLAFLLCISKLPNARVQNTVQTDKLEFTHIGLTVFILFWISQTSC